MNEHKKWLKEEGGECADLRYADLRNADLSGADLSGADLCNADLSGADLCNANLCNANLRDADLRNANLRGADLRYADLRYAKLSDANLEDANLIGAEINYPIACPDSGSFVAWKKCRDNIIVKLLIPGDAKRLSATGRKCRCNKATVLELQMMDGSKAMAEKAISKHSYDFTYAVGETKEIYDFDENRWNECSTGIHFFITRQEAVEY